MPKYTCPKCAGEIEMDPPNGEWWVDGDTSEEDCPACGAPLDVTSRVDIRLHASVRDETLEASDE
jgi:rubrerythrin